jgi:hypothetical protein
LDWGKEKMHGDAYSIVKKEHLLLLDQPPKCKVRKISKDAKKETLVLGIIKSEKKSFV